LKAQPTELNSPSKSWSWRNQCIT